MKTILVTLLTALLLLPVSAFGEIQTITHTVKQPFGGSQSPDDARISAVAKAKREALEIAGTYIESLTVVKNYQVNKDEILALSAGVLKAEVVSQENYHTKDAFGIDVVVKVIVDTSVLENRVKKLLQDRTHLEQLNQVQKREKELLQKVVQLEQENRNLMTNKQSTQKLEKEFRETSQGLMAEDWLSKAYALWNDGKCTDPQKAIEYVDEAISLNPDFAYAYNNRGSAYAILGQHQRAIQDYDTAIHLKPDYAEAYCYRGVSYYNLGKSQRAISDLDEAIRLKPDYAYAYNSRGNAYHNLNQLQRAIRDNDTAIRLKPDFAEAYNNRGIFYVFSENTQEGCRYLIRACELGYCKGHEYVKQIGYCR
jgi:tetratricopeptide (TPR) repeat protein